MGRLARCAALLCLTAASPAVAAPAADYPVTIVAAVPGEHAALEETVLVGSSGQLYRRADDGAWRRAGPGGLATSVQTVIAGPGATLHAAGRQTPLFRWDGRVWNARPMPTHGELGLPGPGSSAVVAIGPQVYALEGTRWVRVGALPRPAVAVWAAGRSKVWAADAAGGLYGSTGSGFQGIRHPLAAGDAVIGIAGGGVTEVYALAASGAVLAIHGATAAPVGLPAGATAVRVDAIGPAGTGVVMAGALGAADGSQRPALLRAAKGMVVIDGDLPALAAGDRIAAVRGDDQGGTLLVSARGRVWLRRTGAAWTESPVVGDLPAGAARSFPGAGPAHSR